MSDICFSMDKARLLKGIGVLLAWMVMCLLLLLHDGPRDSVVKDAMLLLANTPLVAMFLVGLSAVLTVGPAIEIDELGIRWNISWMSRGALQWSQIRAVRCARIWGVWFVSLEPHDMRAFVEEQPLLRRALYRAMLRHGWPITPTSVPGTGLRNGSAGAVARHVRRRLKAADGRAIGPALQRNAAQRH